MRISEIFRLVIMNIKQNKFKVFLTSLGIIVGSATIVMVIAIGEGGQQDVAEQFKTLNAGTITVTASEFDITAGMEGMMGMMEGMMGGGMEMGGMSGAMSGGMSGGTDRSSGGGSSAGGGGGPSSGGGMSSAIVSSDVVTLSEEELDNVLFFVPNITSGAILTSLTMDVQSEDMDEASSYTIVGTQSSYQDISNLTVIFGSFITESDEENLTRCVVLGYDVATEMFDSIYNAYDSQVEIDGKTYVVNGVLESVGSVVSGVSPDSSIFMPYSTAEKYLMERDTTSQFSILADDVDNVDSVMSNIELVLTQSNPDVTYLLEDAGATMEAAMESATTLSLLLMAIAVIVFIVGGIGIMNVLFVSVKERTREIGILKALGTKKGNILMLFLIEAGMMGVVGGAIGILVSFAIMPLMDYVEMTVVMTPSAIILAFLFAVMTGTVFGFYPAFQASNLVPIEALNND